MMAFDLDGDSDRTLSVINADDSTLALDIYGFTQRHIGLQLHYEFNRRVFCPALALLAFANWFA
jgi:hypothetical protein